jgi:hypothetical protein
LEVADNSLDSLTDLGVNRNTRVEIIHFIGPNIREKMQILVKIRQILVKNANSIFAVEGSSSSERTAKIMVPPFQFVEYLKPLIQRYMGEEGFMLELGL